ncbi:MAG: sporulation protein [Lachnoclostridium sp.]|nr:sporulation protein [Lachnoclostridium sp.]
MEEIQAFLNALSGTSHPELSFSEIMENLAAGNLTEILKSFTAVLKQLLLSELTTNGELVAQIVILALIGAVFSGFSGIFGSGHVSETGFYVVYLLTMTFLAASFFASVRIAMEVTGELLGFMQVLLPAYFLAVAAAGGALTSASICGFTIGAIGLVQSILSEILIPLTKIFMMMVMAGNLLKEDMISKLTELLGNVILWTMKTMFGVIVGFHVIQGMVLPQADALKNASAMRLAQAIPGVGGGLGAVSQIVMGSGILIKNTAGAAAVIILLVLAAIPVMKLCILMVLYYMAAAVMQPVCDKRLVSCMTGAAAGHGLLLKLVGYSLALFVLTIAVICVSTNAVWYAG